MKRACRAVLTMTGQATPGTVWCLRRRLTSVHPGLPGCLPGSEQQQDVDLRAIRWRDVLRRWPEDQSTERAAVTLGDAEPATSGEALETRDGIRTLTGVTVAPLTGLAPGDEPVDRLVKEREQDAQVLESAAADREAGAIRRVDHGGGAVGPLVTKVREDQTEGTIECGSAGDLSG